MSIVRIFLFLAAALAADTASAGQITIPGATYGPFCPIHNGGDREFAGHGPETVSLISLFFNDDFTTLHYSILLMQLETRSDWTSTFFSTESNPAVLAQAPAGTRFTEFWNGTYWRPATTLDNGQNSFYILYTDDDWATDFFYGDSFRFWLDSVQIKGDTHGDDVGNCTSDDASIKVLLETIYLKYE